MYQSKLTFFMLPLENLLNQIEAVKNWYWNGKDNLDKGHFSGFAFLHYRHETFSGCETFYSDTIPNMWHKIPKESM